MSMTIDGLAATDKSSAGTFPLLGWMDSSGKLWLAPLGTPAPDPDSPMSLVWVPVRVDNYVRDWGNR